MGRYFSRWLFFSFGALLCWGVFGFLSKVGAAQLSPMQLQLVFSAGILATTLPAWPGSGISVGSDRLGLLYGTLTGLLSVIANLAVFSALQNGTASIIQPATGLYPLVTVILASIVLKERINPIQAFGVALALVALWILSL
jgi:bacterial/archaeal transporter family protein